MNISAFIVFLSWILMKIRPTQTEDRYCQSGDRLEEVAFSKTIKDRILEGFVASVQPVSTDQECQMLCILDGMCNSYNLGVRDSSFHHTCQVLRFGVGNQTMKLRKGWSLRARKCLSSPCLNGNICFISDQSNKPKCVCEHPVTGSRTCSQACEFDFERGIGDWKKTGTAFNNQPTYGDNPTARNREPSNQQGNWWIGGAENRSSKSSPAGNIQGDGPQGTLTSPLFTITGKNISFLIGGGCDTKLVRAELVIGGKVVKQATGRCKETMTRNAWDVGAFVGQRARVKLVDSSSGGLGILRP